MIGHCIINGKDLERVKVDMNTVEKIKVLESRLQKLVSSEKENYGVCRKIRREIRNLQRKSKLGGMS